MTHHVELLWFRGCANHQAARRLVQDVIDELAPGLALIDIDASDPDVARRLHFPGSPTIRVDGRDVDPRFVDGGDYTPRCRLYLTESGMGGLPDRRWIETALRV